MGCPCVCGKKELLRGKSLFFFFLRQSPSTAQAVLELGLALLAPLPRFENTPLLLVLPHLQILGFFCFVLEALTLP